MYPDDPQQRPQSAYPHHPQQPRDPAYAPYPPPSGPYQPYPPYPPQEPRQPQQPAGYPPYSPYPSYPRQPAPTQPYQPYAEPFALPPTPPQRPPVRRRPNVLARLVVSLLVSLLIGCVALTGLSLALEPQSVAQLIPIAATQVTGTIDGENLAQRVAGYETPTPLAHATITCGAAHATADAQGHFALRLLRGRSYTCDVSAPLYMPTRLKLSPRLASAYQLDLGPAITSATASADCVVSAKGETCPALKLLGGSLTGQVTNLHTYAPLARAQVLCWDNSVAAQASADRPASYATNANANGYYTLANTPPGPYLCVANQQGAPRPTALKPGMKTTLNFAECDARCGGVTYHAGPVMHTFRAYIIFWAPAGVSFEPDGSSARFKSLIRQYFTDVGGSSFYGLLTQYWDVQGPVRNNVSLGGVYVDTHAYPHAGTRADPLTDSDIITEISLARERLGWKVTPGAAFIMVTGYNVEECAKFSNGTACSFSNGAGDGFCAYHSFTPNYGGEGAPDFAPYIYAVNNANCAYLPTFDNGAAPYGDQVADAVINLLSHEQFETVTDPETGGWYSGDPSGGEIADKCETSFGPVNADGSTVTLSHGHSYALQREYSNRLGACSYR